MAFNFKTKESIMEKARHLITKSTFNNCTFQTTVYQCNPTGIESQNPVVNTQSNAQNAESIGDEYPKRIGFNISYAVGLAVILACVAIVILAVCRCF